jgi:hypothetical protein
MQIVSPRIMSQAIGMHPLFTVAALLVGLQLAGPWGALFGIPAAGVLHQVAGPYFARLRGFFNVPAPHEPALALQGTSTVTTTATTIAAAEPPGPVAPPVTGPAAPSAFPTVWLLARGLGRRALARRRSRP